MLNLVMVDEFFYLKTNKKTAIYTKYDISNVYSFTDIHNILL